MNDIISAIQLIRSEGVGPRTYYSLVKKFGSIDEALVYVGDKAASRAKVEAEIKQTEKMGVKILIHSDLRYPQALTHTYDAPPVLFYKGNLGLLERDSIAFVGTRNASANGCAITRKLASEIGNAGFNVISGLARGIDTEAHKASLKTGTIAIVAGGLDVVYPPENKKLYEQISETGLIIGENPVGTEPVARHFPQRNRIIAGIARGIVVVEAARKSGSIITAEYAVREGREVFAVPGSPLDPRYGGTNYLIKNGAQLVEDANDILDNLGHVKPITLREPIAEFDFEQEEVVEVNVPSNLEEIIISKIGKSPVSIDELASQLELPISKINEVLIELELTGRLHRQYGNKVSLAA
jgi:DNA processing protein